MIFDTYQAVFELFLALICFALGCAIGRTKSHVLLLGGKQGLCLQIPRGLSVEEAEKEITTLFVHLRSHLAQTEEAQHQRGQSSAAQERVTGQ